MSSTAEDARWMRAAIRQAKHGQPSPNPHVGAVIVKNGRLVGKGFHRAAGKDHAEVAALQDAGVRAKGATLYVTFEPCNHHGRTPPCTDAIVAAGLARVVVGARDPIPHRGGATRKMRRAGVMVEHGVCRDECEALVRDFVIFMRERRPCVTLKSALTLDGRTATSAGESKWITGVESRKEAHRMRARHDAVLVGAGTARADDPELTVRLVRKRSPLRVVLDSTLSIRPNSRLVQTAKDVPLLVCHGPAASARKQSRLHKLGVETLAVREGKQGLRLDDVLAALARRDVVRLLVEGGAGVHGAFLRAGRVDRVACFIAPILAGDPEAIPMARGPALKHLASALRLCDVSTRTLGDDVLITGWVDGHRHGG